MVEVVKDCVVEEATKPFFDLFVPEAAIRGNKVHGREDAIRQGSLVVHWIRVVDCKVSHRGAILTITRSRSRARARRSRARARIIARLSLLRKHTSHSIPTTIAIAVAIAIAIAIAIARSIARAVSV